MSTQVIKPGWSPLSILLMVIGFIVFWPLGLAMLAYILWGDEITEFLTSKKQEFRRATERASQPFSGARSSGNAAFDAYREEELRKLEERRRQLDREVEEFRDFIEELKRARDREEFDAYMARRREAATKA